jgi:MFS family permease
MGAGIGLAFSAMAALVVAAVPAEQTGVASGMNANIRTIGGSIGAALMASIVTARLESNGLPRESGYTIGFAVLAVGMVLAALAALRIPIGRRPVSKHEAPHAEMAMVAGGTVVGYDSGWPGTSRTRATRECPLLWHSSTPFRDRIPCPLRSYRDRRCGTGTYRFAER